MFLVIIRILSGKKIWAKMSIGKHTGRRGRMPMPLADVVQALDGCGKIDCNECAYHCVRDWIDVDDCQSAYADGLFYLKEYQEILKKPPERRLIAVLREVRGEK